ncbi:MAG TPA: hypothetical protein VGJ46_00035 [Candidatus Limnocylindrales bacterium]
MNDDRSLAPAAGRADVDAAKAEVLAARQGLVDETVRFAAAARSAVDIPARVRDDPLKVGGAAAGVAFLVAGGPQRVFRRVRRLIWGPEADLPKSMLPQEVDRTLRRLGTDGEKVRGTLEREFADYLEAKSKVRKERDLAAVAAVVLGNILKPASSQAGKRLAQSLFSPDRKSFEDALRRFGARRAPGEKPPSDQPWA